MRLLFYLHHPAQFYLFRHVINRLKENGHDITVVATKKDVLEHLIRSEGWTYKNFLPGGRKNNPLAIAAGLLSQDFRLFIHCLRNRPDLMIGTSTEICHVGRLLRIPNIFVNEDDADAVPLVKKIAHPFARHLLSPDVCDTGQPEKTISYPGYHELAYLHPDLFSADASVAAKYVDLSKPFVILRFSALGAHHDRQAKGFSDELSGRLISLITRRANVYITSEKELRPELEAYRLRIKPQHLHHVLAHCSLLVGDSQTMCAEAGVLGVPFIRYNNFIGRVGYLKDLEENYTLGFGVRPGGEEKMFTLINELLSDPTVKEKWQEKRSRMLKDKINVADYLFELISTYPDLKKTSTQFPE